MFRTSFLDKSTADLKLNWSDSSLMDRFKSTLFLSDEAKEYLVFRQITAANSEYDNLMIIVATMGPSVVIFAVYNVLDGLSKAYKITQFTRHRAPIFFTLSALLSFLTVQSRKFLFNFLDVTHDVDSIVNKTYQRGAAEYFAKAVERNKLLRIMLGKKGEKIYDVNGNDRNYIGLPVTKRLDNVRKFKPKRIDEINTSSMI